LAERTHATIELSDAFLGIAESLHKLGQNDSAIFFAKESLLVSKDASLINLSLGACTFLSSLYETKNLIDSAYKYQKMSITLKDCVFNRTKIKQVQSFAFAERLRQQEMREQQEAYGNKIRVYVLIVGLIALSTITIILLQNNKQKQKLNIVLAKQKEEIQTSLTELKSTQAQLIQSEKMASLGELTAGIAHEIQNPLNFVNNFSEVSNEMIDEMNEELDKGDIKEAKETSGDIKQNLEKIIHHGKRADVIVKSMLQHSRASTGKKELTDINALADEYLRLSYHGMRAKDKNFNAEIKTDYGSSIGKINAVPQDIGRVLLNLFNNAFYAVNEKKKVSGDEYEPVVSVCTKKVDSKVEIVVKDNGNGIPQKVVDKIFQPFFTTKPTGQGTGLGLSLSYDIIKAHNGEIKVDSKEGVGSKFIIQIAV
jgi:two-component system NtrC family sensor kinase